MYVVNLTVGRCNGVLVGSALSEVNFPLTVKLRRVYKRREKTLYEKRERERL